MNAVLSEFLRLTAIQQKAFFVVVVVVVVVVVDDDDTGLLQCFSAI